MTGTDDIQVQNVENIWDAIEKSPVEAANMRIRSNLMMATRQAVAGWNVTQSVAARRLGITQPRLNDLLRGKINNFSVDTLMVLAARAGLKVRLEIEELAA